MAPGAARASSGRATDPEDGSELNPLEAALAASERRFWTLLEASPDAIVAVDGNGRIRYANPNTARMFAYEPAELIGMFVEELIPSGLAARHRAHRAGFIKDPVARPMGIGLDLAARRRDGSELPVEISLAPVETSESILVFATIVDITARKGLEEELLQARKMESIGRLAGGIAHDFNNMLSAIRGYADLLLEDLASPGRAAGPTEMRRSIEAIRGAADRAATLTGQLLAFSRQQVLSPTVVDVNEIVRAIEPMIRRLIGEPVRLVVALQPDAGRVRVDPNQLDQIVVNLAVNARDALPDGGTITIETASVTMTESYAAEHFDVTPGRYVVLAVSDDGIGMDRETREQIFEPFFTTKERGKGTGLGLATTYGIVRQSGGHVWLYSEPGVGTTFKVYLPQVEAALELEATRPEPGLQHGSGTIVLVEDEPTVREFTRLTLERAGYTVAVASDAAEAEHVLASSVPVVALVTDVVMPGMSGPELARLVLDQFRDAGVVLLSGYTEETLDLADVLARGARFVPKPFTPDDLTSAVASAIQARTAV